MSTRFVLDYDTSLEMETKNFLIDNMEPSMMHPDGTSVQFSLSEVIEFIIENRDSEEDFKDDLDDLISLKEEGVDYIEIC